MKEEKYIKTFQLVVIIASAAMILALAAAWIVSGPGQDWHKIQNDYRRAEKMISDSGDSKIFVESKKGIQQYAISELNRVDRCVTCHEGIENPFMDEAPQPNRFHPGDFLIDHPVDKYGCTICHGGQGRALNMKDAHGTDPEAHWGHPLLSEPYIQSACGQCHLSIFTENEDFAGTDVFRKGHDIFSQEGCLGCHKARGVGGIVGPDLTEQGEKTRHDYSFQNIQSEQSIPNWMKEHFRDPEMVSPGSQMLKVDLPEEDLDALSTFVMGLGKPDISFEYFSLNALNEFKGNRSELSGEKTFLMACSACHGKDGLGKSYEEYKSGAPAIQGEDFLRVASEEYIDFTLQKGRSQRRMASWMTDITGLRESELVGLAAFLKSRFVEREKPFRRIKMITASAVSGAQLFTENCEACHGENAEGGVALALKRKDMLKNADDEYLYNTLIIGRKNATMPSWSNLEPDALYDLLKYLRSFQSYEPMERTIRFSETDTEEGRLKYHFMCSRCHGDAGQGQTGPALINKGFLSSASDAFLYSTISSGREHTAMFGWSKDVYNAERLDKQDIGNIITFIRQEANQKPDYIYAGANPGNRDEGGPLYRNYCGECHGEKGEGKKAPALNNQELLNAATNGYLMATITIGRAGSKMPEWGKETKEHVMLTGKERQDIVAYIRAWERIRIGY